MGSIDKLLEVMERLRDADTGCPWDQKQDFSSIAPYTVEEAYEVADAIARKDFVGLRDELGDLLFQVVFYCQLAEEEGRFSFDEVVNELEVKLTSRHPHVFGDAVSEDSAWETHKAQERARADATSEMDDVPLALPALSRARKVQKRASRVGFDWPDEDGAWAKLGEELSELRDALDSARGHGAVHDELGDVLFSLVNVARHLDVEPESSLRDATVDGSCCNGSNFRHARRSGHGPDRVA